MFIVFDKETKLDVAVYDVRTDATGYPLFLVRKNNEWKYISAKHYITSEDIISERKLNEEDDA